MAWTNITKPNGGDPTEKSLIDAIIDNLMHLFGLAGSATLAAGANGSFENDTDSDGVPDSWTFAALPNGTGTIYNSTAFPAGSDWSSHGGNSFRFTRSLGVGNGGGTLTSEDFFEISPLKQYLVQWQMKSSDATLRTKVEILWYTRQRVAISSTEIYNNNATNPTAWALRFGSASPPSNAYYAKLKITGGDTSPNVAATVDFDDVIIQPVSIDYKHEFTIQSAGTFRWIAPISGLVEVMLYGAGGGGGGCDAGDNEGGGGGGGAFVHALVPVTSGTTYTIVVGAGGAGGTSAPTNGSAGTATTFTGGYSAGGGSGGVGGGSGAGGAGGVASGGVINTDGTAGSGTAGAGTGGNGGRCGPAGWRGGLGGTGAGNDGDHSGAGGGGAGDAGAGAAGGAGKDGKVTIRYKT